jgi:hypothetical protein
MRPDNVIALLSPQCRQVHVCASTGRSIQPSISKFTPLPHLPQWTGNGDVLLGFVALEAGGVVCGTSTPQSATDWSAPTAFHEFDITLRPTTQYYRIEAQISAATHEGYVAGAVLYPKGAA